MSCGRLFTIRLVVVLVVSEPLPQPPEFSPRPDSELVEALLKWPTRCDWGAPVERAFREALNSILVL